MIDLIVNFSSKEETRLYTGMIEELSGRHLIYSEPVSELRSNELNRYYRVLLQYLSYETKHSEAFLHDYCKTFFSQTVKWRIEITPTTSDMTTKQMMAYFEWIKIHFSRMYPRMKWPNPDEVVRPR